MNTLPATPMKGILYKNRGEGGYPRIKRIKIKEV